MIPKTASTPRGEGVQHRSIRKILPFLAFSFIFGAIFVLGTGDSAYADSCAGSDAGIKIDSSGVTYSDNTDQSTVDYNESDHTLALNNYNGGNICIIDGDDVGDVALVLKGENRISRYTAYPNIENKYGRIIIEGDGKLYLQDDGTVEASELIVNGGNIEGSYIYSDALIMNSGSITGVLISYDIIVINDGQISSTGIFSDGDTGIFNQNGGVVNIEGGYSDGDDVDACLSATRAVFNGGTLNIDCSLPNNSAMELTNYDNYQGSLRYLLENIENDYVDDMGYSYEENAGLITLRPPRVDADIIAYTDYIIVFNGGDIRLKSNFLPLDTTFGRNTEYEEDFSSAEIQEIIDLSGGVKIGDNMIIDPTSATLKTSLLSFGRYRLVVTAFTDGTDGTYVNIDEDFSTALSDNFLKTVHIYEGTAPIPNTDGTGSTSSDSEENPNTLDYHLLSIISTILVSIIAEAFIIIDLKKRTKVLQDQIIKDPGNN